MDNQPQEVILDLPIFLRQTKGKVKWLTLNNYRNWHYQTSNGCESEV